VRLALEGEGFEVCAECSDAPGAVAAAERHRPDLCLLDIRMPGNGIEAAARITSRLPQTAVVMLTVSRDDDDLFEALRAGASGYLLKDTTPARLASALRAVLAGEPVLSPGLVARLIQEFRGQDAHRHRFLVKKRGGVQLTPREWEVLGLLRAGLSTAEIAARLSISQVTVRRHVARMLKSLRVSNREAAVRLLDGD
jgi:DNA-binding NarL/FixJ family response regulator